MKTVIKYFAILLTLGFAAPVLADTDDAMELGTYCCESDTYMGRTRCLRWCSTDVGERPSPDTPSPAPPPVNDSDRGSRGKQE